MVESDGRPDAPRDAGRRGGRRARAVPPGAARRRPACWWARTPWARASGARPSTCRCAPAPASPPWRRACWRGSIRPRRRCSPGRPRATPGWARSRRRPSPGRPCGCGRSRGLVAVAVRAGGGRAPAPRGSRDGRRRRRLAGAPHAARLGGRRSRGGGRRARGCWPPARARCARWAAAGGAGRRGGRGRPARGPARARAGARGARDGGAPEARAVRRLARRRWSRCALAALAVLAGPAAAAPILSLQDDDLVNVRGPALDARLDALAATGTKVTRVDVLWRRGGAHPAGRRAQPGRSRLRLEPLRRDRARPVGAGDLGHPRLLPARPAWASRTGLRHRRAAGGRRGAASPARSPGATRARSPTRPARSCRRCAASRSGTSPTSPGFWMPQCRQRAGPGGAGLAAAPTPRSWRPAYREIKRREPRRRRSSAASPGRPAARRAPASPATARSRRQPRLRPPGGATRGRRSTPGACTSTPSEPAQGLLRALVEHAAPGRQSRWIGFGPGAPIHVTETGYHTSYNRFHRYFVSEAQQAAWLDETVAAAAAHPRVQVVTWFNFQDNPLWTGGLLRGDGSRKPSYDRFVAAGRRVPPAAGVGAVSEGERGAPGPGAGLLRPPGAAPGGRREPQLAPAEPHGAGAGDHRPATPAPRRPRCSTWAAAPASCWSGSPSAASRASASTSRPSRWSTRSSRLRDIGAADRLDAEVGSAYEPPAGPVRPDRAHRRARAPGGPARLPAPRCASGSPRTACW